MFLFKYNLLGRIVIKFQKNIFLSSYDLCRYSLHAFSDASSVVTDAQVAGTLRYSPLQFNK